MPTDAPNPEPPTGQPKLSAGRKKHIYPDRENAGTLPDSKRFKFDPSLEPPREPSGTPIPDTFHFAISGELTPSRVENIKAWVYTNKPAKVYIWYDEGASLLTLVNRKIVEKAFKQSKGATNSSGEPALHEREAFYTAIRKVRKQLVKDSSYFSLGGNTLAADLKDYLINKLDSNPEEIAAFLEKHSLLKEELARLNSIAGTEVEVKTPKSLGRNSIKYIRRAEFELGNLQQANDLITLYALDREGGFGLDSRLSPAQNDSVLSVIFAETDLLASASNLNEQQKRALKYFKAQQILNSDPDVRVDLPGDTRPEYGSQLPPELEAQVIADVTAALDEQGKLSITNTLRPLDRSALPNASDVLILPDADQALSERPSRVLASTKSSSAVWELITDVRWGMDRGRKYIKNIIDFDRSSLTTVEFQAKVIGFEHDIKRRFQREHPQATDAEADEYLRVVEGEYSAVYLDLDRRGVIAGPVAWKRRATGTASGLSEVNPYTAAMGEEGAGGFKPVRYQSLKSFDRQLIITVPNRDNLPRPPDRPERFDPSLMESDGFRFNKHPDSSYWLMVD